MRRKVTAEWLFSGISKHPLQGRIQEYAEGWSISSLRTKCSANGAWDILADFVFRGRCTDLEINGYMPEKIFYFHCTMVFPLVIEGLLRVNSVYHANGNFHAKFLNQFFFSNFPQLLNTKQCTDLLPLCANLLAWTGRCARTHLDPPWHCNCFQRLLC